MTTTQKTRHAISITRTDPTAAKTRGYYTWTAACICGWDRLHTRYDTAEADALAHSRETLKGCGGACCN